MWAIITFWSVSSISELPQTIISANDTAHAEENVLLSSWTRRYFNTWQ